MWGGLQGESQVSLVSGCVLWRGDQLRTRQHRGLDTHVPVCVSILSASVCVCVFCTFERTNRSLEPCFGSSTARERERESERGAHNCIHVGGSWLDRKQEAVCTLSGLSLANQWKHPVSNQPQEGVQSKNDTKLHHTTHTSLVKSKCIAYQNSA